MELEVSEKDSRQARRVSLVGFAVILLAFAVPFFAIGFGHGDAATAGYSVASTLGSLLVLAAIAWLATRKGSALSKARARLVIGVILVGVVVANLHQDAQRDQKTVAFAQDFMAYARDQQVPLARWEADFAKVDLATVLVPANLTTPAGRATARAMLAQYRALLAEQKSITAAFHSKLEDFVRTQAPTDRLRDMNLASMAKGRQSTEPAYHALADARRDLAEGMDAVVAWGEKQGANLGVRDGKLLFSSAAQQAELQALLVRLGDLEKRHDAALTTAQAVQQESRAKLDAGQAGLDSLKQ